MKAVNPTRADGQRPTSLKIFWSRTCVVELRDMGISAKGVAGEHELEEPAELPAAACVRKQ